MNSLDWREEYTSSSVDYDAFVNKNVIPQVNPLFNKVENFGPMWLNMKANQEDTPPWHEATTGPYNDGLWKAMEAELETLERIEA